MQLIGGGSDASALRFDGSSFFYFVVLCYYFDFLAAFRISHKLKERTTAEKHSNYALGR